MLKLNNITKKFGPKTILDNISLKFNPGEIVAIIGPSGGGKSTLLRIINQLEIQDSGTIEFKEQIINQNNILKSRTKIGMVFQNFNLFNNMNVLENVASGPIYVKKFDKDKAYKIAEEKISQVGLLNKKYEFPKNLSGGEKQRVAIARCLAMDPEIILFDEPTSALDPQNVRSIIDLISQIIHQEQSKKIVIFVTHEIYFMKKLANRVIVLEKGKISIDMSKEQFLKSNIADAQKYLHEI